MGREGFKFGLGTKLLVGFLIIALAPMVIAAFTAVRGINEGIEMQAQSAINSDLNSAKEIFKQREQELSLLTSLISLDENVAVSIETEDWESLERLLSRHYENQNLCFLTVTNGQGNVIYRATSENRGDNLLDFPFLTQVLQGEKLEGTVILEEDFLLREGLEQKAYLRITNTEGTSESGDNEEKRGLAILSGVPVYDSSEEVLGMILTGDLLNNNFYMVDRIGELLGVTSTIFLEDLRISTNVRDLSGSRAVGTRVSQVVSEEVLTRGERYLGKAFVVTEDYITAYGPINDPWGKIVGILYVGISEAPFNLMKDANLNRFIVIGLISLVLAIVLAYFLTRGVTLPITELMRGMKKAEDGDLSAGVSFRGRDELGRLANSFAHMLKGQREIVQKMLKTADLVSHSSQALSASIEESNAAMQEISSTVEGEVARKAQDIALTSQQAADSGVQTKQIASQGASAIGEAVNTMLEIDQAASVVGAVIMDLDEGSKQIGVIVNTITEIAEQTNLLALNAAIEAARAGEQGQGFAVVAKEVRKLAEESRRAAGEIEELISDIQKRTGNCVEKMNETSKIVKKGTGLAGIALEHLEEITGAVDEVGDYIQEIALAIEEQSASTEEIAASTEEQTGVLEDISKTTNELANMAEELNALIRKFKLQT